MSLLDGQIAQIFAGIFGGIYLAGQLYRSAAFTDDGMGGGSSNGFAPAETIQVQIDQATQGMQLVDGYVEGDVRILVLAHGVAMIGTDCEVAAGGKRYMVEAVNTDPAGSYYELRGRLKLTSA